MADLIRALQTNRTYKDLTLRYQIPSQPIKTVEHMFTVIFYDFKITDVHNIIVFKWSVILK